MKKLRQKAKKYKALYENAINKPVKYQIKTTHRNIKKLAASMYVDRAFTVTDDDFRRLMAGKFVDAIAENMSIEKEDIGANTVKVTIRLDICERE